MALHYHGLPLTPISFLELLAGKNVCISYATTKPAQVSWALKNAQSIMWDNGAFTFYHTKQPFDEHDYYRWVEPKLGHPHWAVIPDVIGGDVEALKALVRRWPFSKDYGAPVWHLGLPLDYLLELTDYYPRICIGSSAQYWKVGSPAWNRRMDETFDYLAKRRSVNPWLHGLRMLSKLNDRWPLASADSVNVARNFKTRGKCPGCMSRSIDIQNPPLRWK